MNQKWEKHSEIFKFLLLCSTPFILPLVFLNDIQVINWPPADAFLLLGIRTFLFFCIFFGSVFFIFRAIDRKNPSKLIVGALAIFAFSIICMMVLLRFENPVHPVTCCMMDPITYWGWPYYWIKCYTYEYCGIVQGKVIITGIIVNLIVFFGIAVNALGLYSIIASTLKGKFRPNE